MKTLFDIPVGGLTAYFFGAMVALMTVSEVLKTLYESKSIKSIKQLFSLLVLLVNCAVWINFSFFTKNIGIILFSFGFLIALLVCKLIVGSVTKVINVLSRCTSTLSIKNYCLWFWRHWPWLAYNTQDCININGGSSGSSLSAYSSSPLTTCQMLLSRYRSTWAFTAFLRRRGRKDNDFHSWIMSRQSNTAINCYKHIKDIIASVIFKGHVIFWNFLWILPNTQEENWVLSLSSDSSLPPNKSPWLSFIFPSWCHCYVSVSYASWVKRLIRMSVGSVRKGIGMSFLSYRMFFLFFFYSSVSISPSNLFLLPPTTALLSPISCCHRSTPLFWIS